MLRKLTSVIDGYRYKLPDRSIEELKGICHILFIDDVEFEVPNILIDAGWVNTSRVEDIKSLDLQILKRANVIFVDIGGVGRAMRFADEGLGLISALKKRYPEKKVVVYSAQRRGDRFHPGLSDADERLPKNADPFQFESIIEKFARETFSLSEVLQRLERLLNHELGLNYSPDEIRRLLAKVGRNRDYSPSMVAKIFQLQEADVISMGISSFLEGS